MRSPQQQRHKHRAQRGELHTPVQDKTDQMRTCAWATGRLTLVSAVQTMGARNKRVTGLLGEKPGAAAGLSSNAPPAPLR